MNVSDLATLAANAGFAGSDISVAAAIALAESNGNPTKYNAETQAGAPPGQGSYGLWQIYLFKHPQFAGVNLYDPQTNANAAFSIYQSEGFRAWTTYKTGAYLNYLSAVAAAAGPLTIDNATGQPVAANGSTLVDTAQLAPAAVGVLGLTLLAAAVYVVADSLAD